MKSMFTLPLCFLLLVSCQKDVPTTEIQTDEIGNKVIRVSATLVSMNGQYYTKLRVSPAITDSIVVALDWNMVKKSDTSKFVFSVSQTLVLSSAPTEGLHSNGVNATAGNVPKNLRIVKAYSPKPGYSFIF